MRELSAVPRAVYTLLAGWLARSSFVILGSGERERDERSRAERAKTGTRLPRSARYARRAVPAATAGGKSICPARRIRRCVRAHVRTNTQRERERSSRDWWR